MNTHIVVRVHADLPSIERGLVAMLSEHPDISASSARDETESGSIPLAASVVDLLYLPNSAGPLEFDGLQSDDSPVVALLEEAPTAWEGALSWPIAILPADVGSESLIAAVHAVANGLSVVEPAFAREARLQWGTHSTAGTGGPAILTPREFEVLELVSEGLPNKTIAHHLGISEHTVKFHLGSVMGKLGAESRTEAVMVATRQGILTI